MNTQIVLAALNLTKTTVAWLSARRSGDNLGAAAILQTLDLNTLGLGEDELKLVQLSRAGLAYITQRGVLVEQVVTLIESAEAEGKDLTIEQVRAELDLTAVELDETEQLIEQMSE